LRHKKNKGHQAARNTGIRNARGNYIAFLDSDDTWIPQKIELQIDALNKKGDDYVALCGFVEEENGLETRSFEKPYEGYVYPEILASPGPSFASMLIPRDNLRQLGFLDESTLAQADWDMCISLSKLFEFTTVDEPCVNYYQDDPSSVQKNKRELALSYQYIVEKHQNDMLRFIGRRGLARHYVAMALLFDDAGDFGRCRTFMVKAFENDDRDPMIFLLAFSMLLGERVFHLRKPIARIKKRITHKLTRT
jgi:glycosyltransferase involved in cell wall biosynthesis